MSRQNIDMYRYEKKGNINIANFDHCIRIMLIYIRCTSGPGTQRPRDSTVTNFTDLSELFEVADTFFPQFYQLCSFLG